MEKAKGLVRRWAVELAADNSTSLSSSDVPDPLRFNRSLYDLDDTSGGRPKKRRWSMLVEEMYSTEFLVPNYLKSESTTYFSFNVGAEEYFKRHRNKF